MYSIDNEGLSRIAGYYLAQIQPRTRSDALEKLVDALGPYCEDRKAFSVAIDRHFDAMAFHA